MKRNQVLDYLHKEILVAKNKLRSSQFRKEQLDREIKELEVQIRDLNGHLRSLQNTFDKALKDFQINPSEYKFDITDSQDHLNELKSINTIADAAYLVMEKQPHAMHISDLTSILINTNLISSRSEDPIPSVTRALMRDKKRFTSLGKGRWEINKESPTE